MFGGVGFAIIEIAVVASMSASLSVSEWSPLKSTTAMPGSSAAISFAASTPDDSGMWTSSSTASCSCTAPGPAA